MKFDMRSVQSVGLSFGEKSKRLIIDFISTFFLFHLIRFLVSYFFFIPFLPGFLYFWFLLNIVLLVVCQQTLGSYFFGAKLINQSDGGVFWIRIILSELFTSLPGVLCIVFCFIRYIPVNLSGLSLRHLLSTILWGLAIIIILSSVMVLFRAKIFKIKMIKYAFANGANSLKYARQRVIIVYSLLLLFGGISRFFHTFFTNDIERVRLSYAKLPLNLDLKNNIFDLWDWIFYTVPRPSIQSVREYTSFLEVNRKNINDYVISLFDKYDHVILCERLHPEMTQYDMIYNLVTDIRFVEKVGNVFTEIGNVESRRAYKVFTDTDFPNDTLFQQALSSFMMENQTYYLLWDNTNWFEFLKKISQFNHKRKRKVEILFSDRANWKYNDKNYNRDSLMANNIITTIKKDTLKKSLTIMNYRHAYLIGSANCGYFISTEFPGKVANILINTVGWDMCPLQSGKWDVAFEQMPEAAYAFDLKNTSFGKDRFDHYIFLDSLSKLQYEDMFSVIIYYQTLYLHYIGHGFPYMMQPENIKTLKERATKLDEEFNEEVYRLSNGYIRGLKIRYFVVNLLDNIFFIWNLIWGVGMLIYLSASCLKQRNT